MLGKISSLSLVFLVLISIIISGCSSDTGTASQNRQKGFAQDEQRDRPFTQGRMSNLTEEEMQKMREERQQLAVEACQDRNEGDSCILKNPRGEMEGICKTLNKNLICTFERPMRQR